MKALVLGTGWFPACSIVDGLVYVAYGAKPAPLILVVLTREGVEVSRRTLDGFELSFPAFGGRWLAYKRNDDWRPVAIDVVTGQRFTFQGQADGNFGLTVNDALGVVAYQWTKAYQVWLGSLADGFSTSTPMTGAPDGLSALPAIDQVVRRKDIRTSVPGVLWPVRRGDLTVGELPDLVPGAPPRGAGVQLDGDVLRVAFAGQDTPTPSCATDGQTYAIVTGGPQGIRVLLGSAADLQTLPAAAFERVPGPINTAAPMSVPGGSRPPVSVKETLLVVKNKDQVRADINELIRFYMEKDGLNRGARNLPPPVVFNDPAITDWFTLAVMQPVDEIKRQIRQFPEWKAEHQGEEPP